MTTRAPEFPDGGAGLPPELERAATEWFFRRDAGFTREEEAAFGRWLRADERHAAALAEIEKTWGTLGEAEPQVISRGGRRDEARQPGSRYLDRCDGGKKSARFAIILATAAAIAVSAYVWRPTTPAPPTTFAERAVTEMGGLRKMELPDGSSVMLNTDSAVDVRFTSAERRVRLLRGEAHFSVAKNPDRPFVVDAGGVAVRAVGTAFNVRRQGDAIEVLVTEGRVRVARQVGPALAAGPSRDEHENRAGLPTSGSPTAELPELSAGDRAIVSLTETTSPQIEKISPAQVAQALAWQKRRLDYTDAPLSEIVADFNRYNQHRLVIRDARLAAQHFGGSFPASDYSSLVQLLETTFGVVVERRERETVLRLP